MFFALEFGLVGGKTSGEKEKKKKIHERPSLDHLHLKRNIFFFFISIDRFLFINC